MARTTPKAVDNLKVFYGLWTDSKDHDISVNDGKRKDELLVKMTPKLRKGYEKEPFDLILRDSGGGVGQFACGAFILDFAKSHSERLVWVGKPQSRAAGDMSVWTRPGGFVRAWPSDTPMPRGARHRPSIDFTHRGTEEVIGSFEFMLCRLADVVEQSKTVKEKLIESAPHMKLNQYILDAVEGRHEQAAWDNLDHGAQQDLLEVANLDSVRAAIDHIYMLICNEDVTDSKDAETASMSFSKFMAQLERRIIVIVAKQPPVGNFMIEKAQSSLLHRFFKDVVRGDRNTSRASWGELNEKVREDIHKCMSMDDGPDSNESLLRIIDPDGVIPFEAHTPSAPSGYNRHWQGANGSWKTPQSAQQLRGGRHDSNSDESWSTEGWSGMSHLESVSRKLSLVLRHDTKIAVRSDGFCKLNDILELRRFKDIDCTVEDINQVVDGAHESGNSKQRFQVRTEGDELWIRANQGYSRKDILAESAYRRLHLDDPNLPDPCVHGTYHWHWDSILKYGLLAGGLAGRQGRNEIHFASEEPGGSRRAISGMRHDCDVAVWLDLRRALEEGLPFYISDNDVILSPGDAGGAIPCRFFLKAMDLRLRPPRPLWPPPAQV